MNLMVYAAYGRAGVTMLQEYCRRLGVDHSDKDIQDLAITLASLPVRHPLAPLLGESPDFQRKDALADALLNPQDRTYTVPQLFDFIERCRLTFYRWGRQAPYIPQCGSLAATPHTNRLVKLPPREQFAAVELFRGTMLRHNLIVHRDDRPGGSHLPSFDNDDWLAYIPIRLPETIKTQKHLPPGKVAVLINQAHSDPDLILPVDAIELRLVEGINGERNIGAIIHQASSARADGLSKIRNQGRSLFEQLWQYDQIVFDTSRQGEAGS